MHPMHQIQTHTEHIQQDLANSQQQQQQQQQHNMTVLESLEPVHDAGAQSQPILSSLDPVIGQQQQAMINKNNEAPPVIHHLVQAQPAATSQQPHLHLLRAPCRQEELQQQQVNENHEQQQEHLSQQQQQQEQQIASSGGSRRNSAMAARQQQQQQQQQQRSQPLDGIVADGGGPIVQWLLENYEIADGESLPRSTVYNHYLAHCRQMHMNSVNAASFGKLIRSVFLGLKTRRLGTRGHSKYHYFGVRAKQHVRLDWIQESAGCSGSQNQQHQHQQHQQQHDTSNQNSDEAGSESGDSMMGDGRLSSMGGSHSSASKRMRRHENNSNTDLEMAHNATVYSTHGLVDETIHQLRHHQQQQQSYDEVEQQQQQQQHYSNGHYYNGGHYNGASNILADGQEKHLGGVWSALEQYDLTSLKNHLGLNGESLVEEHWPVCDMSSLERQLADRLGHPQVDLGGLELSSLLQLFDNNYKSYYKRMLELLSNLQFKEVEHLWLEFWHPTPTPVAHETVGTPNVQWSSSGGGGATSDTSSQHNNGSDVTDQYGFHHHHHQPRQLIHQLSYNQLYQLTGHPLMIERINQIDYKLYSAIESYLMPDLLNPLPRPLVHQIRSLARDFGLWLEAAIKDYDVVFVGEKIKSARAFEYALRRYTSINHLATASRAIWTRRSVLAQMSADLNRIDLRDIEHQVSLMAQVKSFQEDICSPTSTNQTSGQGTDTSNSNQTEQTSNQNQNQRDNIENDVNYLSHQHQHQQCVGVDQQLMPIVQQQPDNYGGIHMQPAQLIASFVHLLDDPYPANMWPDWCRSLVESRVRGQSMEEAQGFILKWNFYISLILRELTLKSAPSLGSFQLLRLLFDEYLYYLVLARLAEAQNKTSTQLLRPSLKTFHHQTTTTTTTTTTATSASSLV